MELFLKLVKTQKFVDKTIYLAVGLNRDGKEEVLGMWLGKNESSSLDDCFNRLESSRSGRYFDYGNR